jgi:hypothetical protein
VSIYFYGYLCGLTIPEGLITGTCGAAHFPSASIPNYSEIFLESGSIYASEMIFNSVGKQDPWDLFVGNRFRIEGKPDDSC